jgi:glycosyltransferase involved in cell wall biosynthesis
MAVNCEVIGSFSKSSKFVVIPCLNEEAALTALETSIREFCTLNPNWTILFIDDGSTDNTWSFLMNLVSKYSNIVAIKSNFSIGKIAAQGKAISIARASTPQLDDFQVALMDADGQHPFTILNEMLVEVGKKGDSIFGKRINFQRKLAPRLGRVILKTVFRLFGLRVDLDISEFGVLANQDALKIANEPKLGFLPISLLIERNCEKLRFFNYRVAPRIDEAKGKPNTRHDSSQLFRKGLLYLYSDSWKIIWKLANRSLLIFCVGISYGIYVGIESVLSDSRNGIASIVLILSIFSFSLFIVLLSIVGMLLIAKEEEIFEKSRFR